MDCPSFRSIAIFTRMYPQFPGRGESCIRPALVPQGRSQGSPLHKGHRQLQTVLASRIGTWERIPPEEWVGPKDVVPASDRRWVKLTVTSAPRQCPTPALTYSSSSTKR